MIDKNQQVVASAHFAGEFKLRARLLGEGIRAQSSVEGAERCPAIEVINTTKEFVDGRNRFRALDDVSLSIRKNEFFTLLGPSGCGKTTLLRLIAGFDYPTRGQIALNGNPIEGLPPFRRSVNTVFQNYALFPHLNVAQNVGFGLKMLGKPMAEVTRRVEEVLALVRLEDMRSRRMHEISGGQQQRVALARALAPAPQTLLLDEPLSALDLKLRREMQVELKRLQLSTGITFIFVTHDQEEALAMSDRVAVMNKGRILQVGTPRQIYESPVDRFVAGFIGETSFLKCELVSVSGTEAKVALSSSSTVVVNWPTTMAQVRTATVAVRPEHVRLTRPGDGTITGVVTSIVYVGADTLVHLQLDSGEMVLARVPNSLGGNVRCAPGIRCGISFADEAVRVMKD